MSEQSTAAIARSVTLRVVSGKFGRMEAGSFHLAKVEVTNGANLPFAFPFETPVNLSYRWYTADGKVLVPEGSRTSLGGTMAPGERRELPLRIAAPDTPGRTILRISLVFEMHFWFFDQFDTGWADYKVLVTNDVLWPAELNASRAAKALRGAVTIDRFKSRLTGFSFRPPPSPVETANHQPIAMPAPEDRTFQRFAEAAPLSAGQPFSYQLWALPTLPSFDRLDVAGFFQDHVESTPTPVALRERWLSALARFVDWGLARTKLGRQISHAASRSDELTAAFRHLSSHLDDRLDAIEANATQRQVWNGQALRETLRGVRQVSEQSISAEEEADRRRAALSSSIAAAFADVNASEARLAAALDRAGSQLKTIESALAGGFGQAGKQSQKIEEYSRSLLHQLRQIQLVHLSLAEEIGASKTATEILPQVAARIDGFLAEVDRLRVAGDQLRSGLDLSIEQVGQQFATSFAAESERTKTLIANLGNSLSQILHEMNEAASRTLAETVSRAVAIESSLGESAAQNAAALAALGDRFSTDLAAGLVEGSQRTGELIASVQKILGRVASQIDAAAMHAEALKTSGHEPADRAHIDSLRQTVDTLGAKIARIDTTIPVMSGKIDKLGSLPETMDGISAKVVSIDQALPVISNKIEEVSQLPEVLGAVGEKVARADEILPFMSGKIDYLIRRQVFAVQELGIVFCRNACGLFGIPDTDAEAVAYFASGEVPEPGSITLAQSLLPRGGLLVDVGANVGLFTVAGARKVGPQGSVVAVEPSVETLRALKTNVNVNGIEAIAELHNCAAGRKAERRLLHIGRTSGLYSLVPMPGYTNTVEVDVQTLDDLVGDRPVDLLKIDVEGWELEVLAGASRLLSSNATAPIIIEFGPSHLANTGICVADWFGVIAALGYMWHAIDEHTGDLRPFSPESANQIRSVNLLLSRVPPQDLPRYFG